MNQNFVKYVLSLFIIFLVYQCPFKYIGNKIIKIKQKRRYLGIGRYICIWLINETNVKLLVCDTK